MSIRASTRALIEQGHRYSAFYRNQMANHLPMALVALDGMGADDLAIGRFAERYSRETLERLDPKSDFARRVRDIHGQIAQRGRDTVLRESLGRLAGGAGSGGFHGSIRTAYALETDSNTEMAHALAYWSTAFKPIEARDVDSRVGSPREALEIVSADLRGVAVSSTPGIAARMAAAARDERFPAWCAPFARDPGLDGIAAVLIDAYARTQNFTLLHAVTGCHAMRMLLPFAPDPGALLRAFWIAVVAAYAGVGAPAGDAGTTPTTGADWPDIVRDAVTCSDEHDVKLVYSCLCEWRHRGGDRYRDVAAVTAAAGARRVAQTAS